MAKKPKTKADPPSQPPADAAWPAYTVVRKPITWLKPYERNARTHSDAQIEQLRGSLRKFGWTVPVLAREDGTIIAGHGRVEAGKREGLTECPVIIATGWSDEQCRAYALADNRIALNSDWNLEILGLEAADLAGLGVNLEDLGFEAEELEPSSDTETSADAEDGKDDAPELPKEPVTLRSDLWALGSHRLLCGDSTKADDVSRLMNGERACLVFTDPPYGVNYQGGSASGSIAGDITQTAIPISFKQAIDIATDDHARLYFCGGSSNVQMYYSLFDSYLRKMPAMLIWDKGSIVLRRNNYHSQYEVVFFGWKGSGGGNNYWFGPRTADFASDVWLVKRDAAGDYLHPTQKPTALAERAIANSSPNDGLVYEPFSGSGSTLIAAQITGRRCFALEVDPRYVDVGVRRWQQYTGQKATLDGDGRTFDEIAAARLPAAA